jgi:hypothetical protein
MSGCKDCDGLLQEGCSDGIGIVSTIENEDSSLTFFYSDGSTFTTSILRPTGYYKSYVARIGYAQSLVNQQDVLFNNLGKNIIWGEVVSDPPGSGTFRLTGTFSAPTSTDKKIIAFITPWFFNTGTYKYFMYANVGEIPAGLGNLAVEIVIGNPEETYPVSGVYGFNIEVREYI